MKKISAFLVGLLLMATIAWTGDWLSLSGTLVIDTVGARVRMSTDTSEVTPAFYSNILGEHPYSYLKLFPRVKVDSAHANDTMFVALHACTDRIPSEGKDTVISTTVITSATTSYSYASPEIYLKPADSLFLSYFYIVASYHWQLAAVAGDTALLGNEYDWYVDVKASLLR
jgi:hypothetical protein